MSRQVFSLLLLSIVCFPLIASWHKSASDPVFSQIQSVVQSLSEITGLTETHPVSFARMSKRQLHQFLSKRMKKTLRPEEIRADEMALKMFGLVPSDFDLKKSTVDLLTEQAAAFYDYDDKKLFMLEESSVPAEITTLAHELSHALADQHFNLKKFMDEAPADDDENLARTAVVEGQASWLMIGYNLKGAGQPVEPTAEMLKAIVNSGESSMADYPVLKGAPLYIQQSLLFPYTDGTAFFDAVYKKKGKAAFAAVFTEPPMDSAQIIHPERYFAHQRSTKPELPKIPPAGNSRKSKEYEISEGSVGEFDHHILLQQYLDATQANSLAPHLRGGDFRIVGSGKSHHPVLLYASEWDSTDEAAKFFSDYQTVLKSKWKHCDITTSRDDLLAGRGDGGFFLTKLTGQTVSSIEGLPEQQQWEKLKQAAEAATVSTLFRSQATASHLR